MKYSLLIIAVIFLAVGAVSAEKLVSGPQIGDKVPPFQVIKVSGPKDGVKVDQKLCYR